MRGISLSPSVSVSPAVRLRRLAQDRKKATGKRRRKKKKKKSQNRADEPAEGACLPTAQRRATARAHNSFCFKKKDLSDAAVCRPSLFFPVCPLCCSFCIDGRVPSFFPFLFHTNGHFWCRIFFQISRGHKEMGRWDRRRGMGCVRVCLRASTKRREALCRAQTFRTWRTIWPRMGE